MALTPVERMERYRKRHPTRYKETQKRWASNHPEKVREKGRRRRERGREVINRLKKSPCTDCGKKYHPECMDFDHVRGEKKKNIAKIIHYSVENLMAEINKCELVCGNCHRLRTFNRRNG